MLVETLNPDATFLVICALVIGFGLGVMVSRRLAFRKQIAAVEDKIIPPKFHPFQSSSWHNDLGGF